MILDYLRELRIEYHFWRGCSAPPLSEESKEHFRKMTELIRGRSPRQVRKMEVRKGLI